ncbi:MAG: 2-C-methyl-D-erythritol 4-phosphate cytidylyltransferase [Alphaproteobacteria bacterium]|nr:2-C-methyl-D-erythritol 4-phosphate cytidylyltransferase [Alphaproteobacteria bacterium]
MVLPPKDIQHGKESHLPSFRVLIPAAGVGRRFSAGVAKQNLMLLGKSVLSHSVDLFSSFSTCKSICVIAGQDDINTYQKWFMSNSKVYVIYGDNSRSLSVFNGIKSMGQVGSEEIILVHDAARPCVRADDIRRLLMRLAEARAATLACAVTSTMRRGDARNKAQDFVDRNGLWSIQTPQGFRYGDLKKAHEMAPPDKEYTDDTVLVSEIGIDVELVSGSTRNIKITVPEDLEIARLYLSSACEPRSGTGFDVHAFDFERSGPVYLCGVAVDHEYALKGHSDADVGLHALTDAILGALGAGDIGQHFPPSNPDFKDMDSAVFLRHAVDLMQARGGRILNLDVTLICEAPKIGPHTQAMQARVADICGVEVARVNVKATTTEGLGFTGRREGIAAQASATLSLPSEEVGL